MNKSNSLKKYIVKKLRVRITLSSIIIAIAFSLYASYTEKQKLYESIIENSLNQALTLNRLLVNHLDRNEKIDSKELDVLVTKFASIKFKQQSGSFIYLDIYNLNDKLLSRSVDRSYKNTKEIINKVSTSSKNITQSFSQKLIELNGIPYIYMQKPLFNSINKPVLVAVAVFAISEPQLKKINYKVLRVVLYVTLIVLITSFILYPIIIDLVTRLSRYSDDLLESNLEIVKVLGSAIAKRDSDTDIHNFRVTIYSVKLAEEISLSEKNIQKLMKGAFLHDVGKIAISDNILLKPGKLTAEEFTVMKTHVVHGIDIVNRSSWLKDSIDVVANHHEKFDGSGYPKGSKGDEIPIVARIFSIADVFDALTSKRPYKEPFPYEKSISIIEQGANQHFDGVLVDKFIPISKALYDKYAGRDDESIKEDLFILLNKYFDSDFSISKY